MSGKLLVAILAGGKGRRIGGGKPQRVLGGETLLARALRIAHGWSDDVRVVVRNPDQAGDAPCLLDDPDIAGPLGGLIAALRAAREESFEAVLTLPCDAPLVPADLAERLRGSIGEAAAAIAASGGDIHPVCGLWRPAALDALKSYLAAGHRSLRGFAGAIGFAAVDWPTKPFDPFFNVNSEEDLRRAEVLLRG